MTDDEMDDEPKAKENLRRQLRQQDFRKAMASAHEIPANDKQFGDLLKRLDKAERDKR